MLEDALTLPARLTRNVAIPVALSVAALLVALAVPLLQAGAQEPATEEFERTWSRTDLPVRDLITNRTWIWGPQGITGPLMEPYNEAPNGERLVQYFDKARMEIPPDTEVDPNSPWFVTTGLLPLEMITGELQLGDDTFVQREPAQINVAGDPTDESAPTYADMAGLLDEPAFPVGETITATIDDDGQPGEDEAFAAYGVTAAYHVPETGHTVASVFWDFMNSSGTVYVDGQLVEDRLFLDPFFGFGFPVTEAYWATIELDGEPTDILIQVFERRVATYTPDNPEGWRVETGNVGAHYYWWRYDAMPEESDDPTATPTEPDEDPTCLLCAVEYGLGEIGERQREPLGVDVINPLLDAYLAFEEAPNDVIDKVVVGTNGIAQIQMPDTISLVSDWSPSKKLFYVVDFNDGSVYIGDLMDEHIGLNVTHIYLGRGDYHLKIWAIDPEAGVRTPVVEVVTRVQ